MNLFLDRDSKEIDISTLIALMRDSSYVIVERTVLSSSKGRIFINTHWTGQSEWLFETTVSNSPVDGYFKRSSSELEALTVHWETVEMIKEILEVDYSDNERPNL